ncbi:MAG: metallophosphoesterase [Proteobacteria bacterium]|nr:metallophosphoesterase [Pseudomonadota bacterium]
MQLTRRRFLQMAGIGASASLVGGLRVYHNAYQTVVERLEVPLPGLPPGLEGLRIGLMADLHAGATMQPSHIRAATQLLAQEQPDIVFHLGDFIESDSALAPACADILSILTPVHGSFAVLGNHDYWAGHRGMAKVRQALEAQGIDALVNESRSLSINGETLYLAGLAEYFHDTPSPDKTFAGVPNQGFTLTLVHEPDYADILARETGGLLPLQLSGHSHGGQVKFPLLGALVLPPMGRRYPEGLARVQGTERQVYTTRGVGHVMPMRLGCPPEVTLLTLRGV